MKKAPLLALLFALPFLSFGAWYTSTNSGDWTSSSSWSSTNAPAIPTTGNHTYTISTGNTITLTSLFSSTNRATFFIQNGATLILDQGIDISDNLTISVAGTGKLIINGPVDADDNTGISISGEAQINGDINLSASTSFLVNGTLNVDGNITSTGLLNSILGFGEVNVTGDVSNNFIIASTLDFNESTLPIELTYFTVTQNSSSSYTFEWETASEIDNEKFITQYSSDATSWEDIMETKGAGNTSVSISYKQDVNFHCHGDIAYFRLKQVDYSGESSTSEIVSINLLVQQEHSVDLFPNPVSDQMLIDNHENQIESIHIYDASLKLVDRISNIHSGKVEYSFGNRDEGIYYVQVKSEEGSNTQKIILKK